MFSLFSRDSTQLETSQSATMENPRELVFTSALDAYMIGYVRETRRTKAEVAIAPPRVAQPGWIVRTA